MIKKILFITFLIQSFSILAETEVDTFVETLNKFEEYCIDQDDELREDVYIRDEFFSCRDSLDYLKAEFENREELMSSSPDVYKQFQTCVEEREKPKILPFASDIKKATDSLTCNENEKKEFEKDCGKAWECNKLRAIKDGASLLPRLLRRPLQKFVKNTVKEKKYDNECIADGKSNCVKDFVYAFAANLWSSASSVWDLVSKGSKSLFNISGWFDDESDKLHAKAIQSKQDVEDFWDDPGKWFSNLIDNIKKGVDDWVRTSVFCSKWEGKPQFSKCIQPLENYDCIDCDDKINATCIAIGAISSEVGVAFLTAGVGTAASLTARAGAKTLAVVATKVSSKVKAIAPTFNKSNKINVNPKLVKAAAIIGAGVSKSTEVAKKIYSVSNEKALALKSKIDNISKVINESKIVMITKSIAEKGNIPGRLSEKIAEKGVLFGAKAVSKVSKGAVKADADKVVKLAQKAKTSDRAQQVLSERTHEKSRFSGHNAKASSIVKRGEKSTGSSESDHSVTSNDGTHHYGEQRTDDRSSRVESTRESESISQRSTSSEERPSRSRREEERKVAKSDSEIQKKEQLKRNEVNKKQEEMRKQAEVKKQDKKKRDEEEKRRIAENKKKEDASDEEHKKATSKKVVAAALAADLAAKGLKVSSEQAEREAEAIRDIANGKSIKFDESLASAKEVLGVSKVSAFSDKALEQASVVKSMYSNENKERIVSDIKKQNSSLSQSEAEVLFNKRQSDVGKAYDYIDKMKNKNTVRAKKKITTKDKLKSIGRNTQLNELSKELAKISEEREMVESGINTKSLSSDKLKAIDNPARSIAGMQPLSGSYPSSITNAPSGASNIGNRTQSSSSSSSSSSSNSSNSNSSGSNYSASQIGGEASSESNEKLVQSSGNESVPSIIDNDLIEEAIEDSSEVKKDEEELIVNTKRNRDLKSLLDKIVNKPVVVESNLLFTRSLDSLKTSSEETKNKLENLSIKIKKSEKIKKKYTYSLGSEKLELYEYEDEVFHLIINNSGDVELIDNKAGAELLNRSAFNIE